MSSTRRHLRSALAAICGASVLLALCLTAPRVLAPRRPSPPTAQETERPRGSFSFHVASDSPRLTALSIRNRAARTIADFWIWNGFEPNFFSPSTIVGSTIHPGLSAKQTATALWRLVVDNSYHHWPATLGMELHDPPIFFAAYGYGMCDDRAAVLATLACVAGLPARTAGFSASVPGRERKVAHVVSEIFYDGGWHMFDPDSGVVFRQDGEVLSLRDARAAFMREPCTLDRGAWPPESVAALIRDDSVAQVDYPQHPPPPQVETTREMGMTLRAAESVTFDFGPGKVSHAMVETPPWVEGSKEPPFFANGTIHHSPRLDDPEAIISAGGMELSNDRLTLANSATKGWAMYDLRFPFPLVDGEAEFLVAGIDPRVEVYITTHARLKQFSDEPALKHSNRWWKQVGTVSGSERHRVRLTPFFRTTTEMPTRYGYLLKLQMSSPRGQCEVRELSLTTTFQFAPANTFRLRSGENRIGFSGEHHLRVAAERSPTSGCTEVRAHSEGLEIAIRYRNAKPPDSPR